MRGTASSGQKVAASPSAHDDLTRLHITPLDPGLLQVIVPASALPNASDISYHTIETFPEKRYGFVNLPKSDADKIRAKLNGAVLKGTKIRIEKARSDKKFEPSGFEDEASKEVHQGSDGLRASRDRKRTDKVLRGVILTGRQVRRGWTETPSEMAQRKKKERSDKVQASTKDVKDKTKDEKTRDGKEKKKRTKSKYTEQAECLLKTKVPPNAAKNVTEEDAPLKKRKKSKGGSGDVTVHEFEKTTKFPSFLKDSASGTSRAAAAEFVEGKGWVDEDGNVLEVAVEKKKPDRPQKKPVKTPVAEDDSDDTSSSGTSSDSSDSDSDSDDSSEAEGDSEKAVQLAERTTPASSKKPGAHKVESSPSSHLKIQIPPSTPSNGGVHPLEALYKRQQTEGTTETPAKSEPFTFFGGGDEDEGEEPLASNAQIPMTPFTKQDYEWRKVRSAAPTPDTAHPSLKQDMWLAQQYDEMEEDMDEADDASAMNADGDAAQGENSSSDFQTWFWANRRELNQSWMKRRKVAAKEKRHRENKARASRAV